MDAPLPPGVSRASFDKALHEFADIVGSRWASSSREDRETYHDAFNAGDPLEFVSGGFVAPADVAEVQAVVRAAGRYGVPLWPVSAGKNLAYGGAAPLVPGTVVLDLKRMNRILEVNEDLAYAFVEPGVSFFDLHRHLRENGIKLWMSVPGPGWGSIVGNGLERGIGYGYYSDHFGTSAGIEVVLPDGELLRLGMGAMANSNSWPLLNYGYGPSLDGMFTQSNYGVVTKMSRFLLPEPESYLSCEVNCRYDAGLEALIDTLRPFQLEETIRNPVVITHALLVASFLSVRSDWYDGNGPVPDAVLDAIQEKLKLGRWNASFALYGSERKVDDSWQRIKQAVSSIDGVELAERRYHPGDPIVHPRDQSQAGIPNLAEFSLANWYGSGGHIDFSPVGPATGKHARIMVDRARRRIQGFGFDHLSGFYCDKRVMRYINTIVFRKDDAAELARVRDMFGLLITDLAEGGYGEYRTHLAYMDAVASTYDFNDHAMRRFQERLKNAIDPKGIIAPGKSGVWPRGYRA
ncbi:MAG: FAD-binding oxidoreductase [Gammaproteobacteria bacterium]|nr:FAD-binding oxidoreductase [Gammaproteobacteria bacterium]